MTRTILVVDDEPKIVRLLSEYLERAGFRVVVAADGDAAVSVFRREKPDLVLLDLMIPGIDGLDVTRAIRRDGETPIIMVTALSEETDRLVGLELGADDYIAKPFSPREVVARVKAVLRRARGAAVAAAADDNTPLTVGDLRIDPVRREVRRGGAPVSLTSYQFDLLAVLARQPGRVFSRMQLVVAVQGETYDGYERTVDAHMKNIRKAIGDDARHPRYVETVRGVGYRLLEQDLDDRPDR